MNPLALVLPTLHLSAEPVPRRGRVPEGGLADGELVVGGDHGFAGYWNNPAETAKTGASTPATSPR